MTTTRYSAAPEKPFAVANANFSSPEISAQVHPQLEVCGPYPKCVDGTFDARRLGLTIRRLRQARGWSGKRLAHRAEVSTSYLYALEKGEGGRIGVDILARIARALGTTTDELLSAGGLETTETMAGQWADLYLDLGQSERRFILRVGDALRELQTEYEERQRVESANIGEGFPSDDPSSSASGGVGSGERDGEHYGAHGEGL